MTPRVATQCEDARTQERLETLNPTDLYIRPFSLAMNLDEKDMLSRVGFAAQKGSLSRQTTQKSYLVVLISNSEA